MRIHTVEDAKRRIRAWGIIGEWWIGRLRKVQSSACL
jgi:hypothetical protein